MIIDQQLRLFDSLLLNIFDTMPVCGSFFYFMGFIHFYEKWSLVKILLILENNKVDKFCVNAMIVARIIFLDYIYRYIKLCVHHESPIYSKANLRIISEIFFVYLLYIRCPKIHWANHFTHVCIFYIIMKQLIKYIL